VIQKLAHRIDTFYAGRATWHNDPFPTLRHRRRLVYETTEVVAADFLL
jgi:hypothetical protein